MCTPLPCLRFFPNGTAAPGLKRVANVSLVALDASVRQIQQGVLENYTLSWAPDCSSATITGATIFGVRHGLETLSQLVSASRRDGMYRVSGLLIEEGPRFPFRGPLLDCARHWHAPNMLLSFLDSLSFHKQNALIWGVGIDQAFVVESALFPNLTRASFGPPGTHVYSRETVRSLVSEANFRGVRLLPYIEVTAPHSPLLMPALQFCNGVPGTGMFHPLHNATWDFFAAFFTDMRGVFAEDYLLLGGDEVDLTCWTNDSEIAAWNQAHGHPTTDLTWILGLYYTNMIAALARAGFKAMLYAEAFGPLQAVGTQFSASDVIFNVWDEGTPGSASPILAAGARVIVSSYCFLMPGETCPGFPQVGGDQPNWPYNYGCELQNETAFDPAALPFLGNILGGGPSRWGEDTDATNLYAFTYPAQMGASEKLWSPRALTNGSFYGTRQEVFADHRCVLVRRGIPVQPTSAYSWQCEFEWEPPMPPRTPRNPNPRFSSWGADAVSGGGAGTPETAVVSAHAERVARALRLKAELTSRAAAAGAPHPLSGPQDYISLWPLPASATPVTCGGANQPAWVSVCSDCAAQGGDCRYLAHGDGHTLSSCQASCVGMDMCNEINHNPSIGDCVFRACDNPAAPATAPYQGYNVYALPSKTAFPVGINPAHFSVALDASIAQDEYLLEVARRYTELILWHPRGTFDRPIELTTLTISVVNPTIRQVQSTTNESYSLTFSTDCTSATISAQTIFGARHGLETFSQMVQADRLTGSYTLGAYFGLYNIVDEPRFDTRGLMVDAARHWLPPIVLLSIMDALSYTKMNKLEVGFGIDWSYTIQSAAFPNLTDTSYGPAGTHFYSRDMIRYLVTGQSPALAARVTCSLS